MTPQLSRTLARLVQLLTFQQRQVLTGMIQQGNLRSLDDLPSDIRSVYEDNRQRVDAAAAR